MKNIWSELEFSDLFPRASFILYLLERKDHVPECIEYFNSFEFYSMITYMLLNIQLFCSESIQSNFIEMLEWMDCLIERDYCSLTLSEDIADELWFLESSLRRNFNRDFLVTKELKNVGKSILRNKQ